MWYDQGTIWVVYWTCSLFNILRFLHHIEGWQPERCNSLFGRFDILVPRIMIIKTSPIHNSNWSYSQFHIVLTHWNSYRQKSLNSYISEWHFLSYVFLVVNPRYRLRPIKPHIFPVVTDLVLEGILQSLHLWRRGRPGNKRAPDADPRQKKDKGRPWGPKKTVPGATLPVLFRPK